MKFLLAALFFSLPARADYLKDIQDCVRAVNSRSFLRRLGTGVQLGSIACAGGKTKATMRCMLDLNRRRYIKGIGVLDVSSIAHACKAGNAANDVIKCISQVQPELQRSWVSSKSQSREMAIAVCAGGNRKDIAIECMSAFRANRIADGFGLQPLPMATLCGGGNFYERAKECYARSKAELTPASAAIACAGGSTAEQAMYCVSQMEDLNQPSERGIKITTFDERQSANLCAMLPSDALTPPPAPGVAPTASPATRENSAQPARPVR